MMQVLIDFLATSTANAAYSVLTGIGFAIVKVGNSLNFSDVSMEISSECSGIRSLRTLLILAAGYMLFHWKDTKRVYSLLSLPLMAVLSWTGNLVRILLIFFISVYYDRNFGLGPFHDYIGYIVYMGELAVMIAFFNKGKISNRESHYGNEKERNAGCSGQA